MDTEKLKEPDHEHDHHDHHDHDHEHHEEHTCCCGHDHDHHDDEDEIVENTMDTEWTVSSTDSAQVEQLVSSLKGIKGVKEVSLSASTLLVTHTDVALHDVEELFKTSPLKVTRNIETGKETSQIKIDQMDCPTEEGLIRKKLKSMDGISGLQFNLMNRILTVSYPQGKLPEIMDAIKSLSYDPELLAPDEKPKLSEVKATKIEWWRFITGLVLAGLAEAAHYLEEIYEPLMDIHHGLSLALAIAAILIVGLGTCKKGLIAMKNFNFNMNALMAVAVTGAILIGSWPEAAMVMVLFEISEAIEQLSMDRARGAIRSLMALTPERASVQQSDGSWETVKADEVKIDDILRVQPGERLAVDGLVTKGDTSINQAPITGESMPVEKHPGDQVFAGTVNENAEFEYKATSTAQNSMPARIINAIESAQGARAPTQRFVDSFAKIYTPCVFVIAIFTALVPVVFGHHWYEWVYKALTLLVIACPCALVISTPVTIVTGLANAAKRGILIKGGVYLEKGRKLKAVAFDKTGTVTSGKPKVQNFELVAMDMTQQQAVITAAAIASRNSHPVSLAVAAYGKEKYPNQALPDVEGLLIIPGQGVLGTIEGVEYYLGNFKGLTRYNLQNDVVQAKTAEISEKGFSPLIMADSKDIIAYFGVADDVKPTSKQAIGWLNKLGVETIMLSGDNAKTAERVGKEVGITTIKGNLLPEDKLAFIDELAKKESVGMAGDGINDAPALARADIGFAMGAAGTDTAIETADVALMDDDLRKLPTFVELSKSTFSVLCQNIFIALFVKLVFIILTYMGLATMWMAVFADTGVCLLVVANGLRLLGWKPSK